MFMASVTKFLIYIIVLSLSFSFLERKEASDIIVVKANQQTLTNAVLEGQKYTNNHVDRMIHGMDLITKFLVKKDNKK